MNDLKLLKDVVLERAQTLANVRLRSVLWDELKSLSLEEVIRLAYLDGVRDGMDYLGHLLEEEAEA